MLPENQIPLSIGLPSKHLWKVRNWSNKLQHETLCSPGWTGCLIAGIHLLPSPIFIEPTRPKNLSQTQPFSSSTDFELSLLSSSHFILTLLLVWFPLPHIGLDLQGKGLSLIRLSFSRDWTIFGIHSFYLFVYPSIPPCIQQQMHTDTVYSVYETLF